MPVPSKTEDGRPLPPGWGGPAAPPPPCSRCQKPKPLRPSQLPPHQLLCEDCDRQMAQFAQEQRRSEAAARGYKTLDLAASTPASPVVSHTGRRELDRGARRRKRRATVDRPVYETWAREQLEQSELVEGGTATYPTPAGDAEAVAWWRGLGQLAITYRRTAGSLAERRATLLAGPRPVHSCCGSRCSRDASKAADEELKGDVAQLAHVEGLLARHGWRPAA